MGRPKNSQSFIICIVRRILANREKQVLLNMNNERESFVKTEGKTIIFGKRSVVTFILAPSASGSGPSLTLKRGSLGDHFLYFRLFFGVLFSMRFRSPLSGGPRPKRNHFGAPGGSKFVLSPTRRAKFRKSLFS